MVNGAAGGREAGLLSLLYFVHITAEYIPLDDDGIITYMPRQGSFLTVKYITMESYIITRKKTDLVLLVSKYTTRLQSAVPILLLYDMENIIACSDVVMQLDKTFNIVLFYYTYYNDIS